MPFGEKVSGREPRVKSFDAAITIATDNDQSALVDLSGLTICAFQFPDALDGTKIQVEVETADGSTYKTMYNTDGTVMEITGAAAAFVPVDPADFAGVQRFRIKTVTAQTANRTFKVWARGLD